MMTPDIELESTTTRFTHAAEVRYDFMIILIRRDEPVPRLTPELPPHKGMEAPLA